MQNKNKPHITNSKLKLARAYNKFANKITRATGRPLALLIAFSVIIIWGVTGPIFGYSDTWQLVINTGTTIITFLMVFLIQNTQNRDTKAMHLKLDELIRAIKDARDELVDLEDLSDEELKKLEEQFTRVRNKAAQRESEMDAVEDED